MVSIMSAGSINRKIVRRNTDKRKPNKRDEQDALRQRLALRDIERAIELTMNSDVGGRTRHLFKKNKGSQRG